MKRMFLARETSTRGRQGQEGQEADCTVVTLNRIVFLMIGVNSVVHSAHGNALNSV